MLPDVKQAKHILWQTFRGSLSVIFMDGGTRKTRDCADSSERSLVWLVKWKNYLNRWYSVVRIFVWQESSDE